MLRYLAMGERALGDYPMPPHVRVNWEFLACLRGRVAPTFDGKGDPAPVSDTLWLFPPGAAHGWIGEARQSCEIVVLHFSEVPEPLERLTSGHGSLSVRLTSAERRSLVRMNKVLRQPYWHPSPLGDIYAQRALMDLSLILMKRFPQTRETNQGGVNLSRILDWERWIRHHLEEAPTVSRAAKVVGISPCQLRRICMKVKRKSPQDVYDKIRFDRAMHLMAESDAKLEKVATETGFSSASNFCRAFKAYVGRSPTAWRKEIYIQYKKPREADKQDHSSHGRRYREL